MLLASASELETYEIEFSSAEGCHTIPGGAASGASGSIAITASTCTICEQSPKHWPKNQNLTNVDGSIPVGTNAHVQAGPSSNGLVVEDSTETVLGVKEDSLATVVGDSQRLGLSHGH